MFPGQCSVPAVYEFLSSNKRGTRTRTLGNREEEGRREGGKGRGGAIERKKKRRKKNDESRSAI